MQLEQYLHTLDIKCEKLLDIGGLQFPVKGRTNSWEVREYKILDIKEEMKGRKADYVGDISRELAYHTLINELESEWDVITCFEVMEYVFDPVTTLKNIRGFLRDDGIAYVSFPFIYPVHPPKGTDFLRYTEDGVKALMKEARFKDVDIHVRRAGPGRSSLKRFFDEEGMKYRRDDYSLLDHIGYVCCGRK